MPLPRRWSIYNSRLELRVLTRIHCPKLILLRKTVYLHKRLLHRRSQWSKRFEWLPANKPSSSTKMYWSEQFSAISLYVLNVYSVHHNPCTHVLYVQLTDCSSKTSPALTNSFILRMDFYNKFKALRKLRCILLLLKYYLFYYMYFNEYDFAQFIFKCCIFKTSVEVSNLL